MTHSHWHSVDHVTCTVSQWECVALHNNLISTCIRRSEYLPKLLPTVAPYLTENSLPSDSYKGTIQCLHTSMVAQTIASSPSGRVLQQPNPPIAEDRTSLARLRSGLGSALYYDLERVSRCTPHHLPHLPLSSHPTSLTVRDLWDRPCSVADHLSSLPFVSLPPLSRPPPEPPPSPTPPHSPPRVTS